MSINKEKLLEDLMNTERSSDILKVLIDYKLLSPETKISQGHIITNFNGFDQHWSRLGNDENRENHVAIDEQGKHNIAALREKLTNMFDANLVSAAYEKGIPSDTLNNENPDIQDVINRYVRTDVSRENSHWNLSNWDKETRESWADKSLLIHTSTETFKDGKSKSEDWLGHTLELVDSAIGMTNETLCYKFMAPQSKSKSEQRFQQGKFSSGGTAALSRCKGGMQLVASKNAENQGDGWSFSLTICDYSGALGVWYYLIDHENSKKKEKKIKAYSINKRIKTRPTIITEMNKKIEARGKELELILEKKKKQFVPRQEEQNYGTFIKLYDYNLSGNQKSKKLFGMPNEKPIGPMLNTWNFSPNFGYKVITAVDVFVKQKLKQLQNGKDPSPFITDGWGQSYYGAAYRLAKISLNEKSKNTSPFFKEILKHNFDFSYNDKQGESKDANITVSHYIFDGSKPIYWDMNRKTDSSDVNSNESIDDDYLEDEDNLGKNPLENICQEDMRVLFLVNGQTHASEKMNIFARKKWGKLTNLSKSMITTVDMTNIDGYTLQQILDSTRTQFKTDNGTFKKFQEAFKKSIFEQKKLHDYEKEFAKKIHDQQSERASSNEGLKDLMEKVQENEQFKKLMGKFGKLDKPGLQDDDTEKIKYATEFKLIDNEKNFQKGPADAKRLTAIKYTTDAPKDFWENDYGDYEVQFYDKNDNLKLLVPKPKFPISNGKATLLVDNIIKNELSWEENRKELNLIVTVNNNDETKTSFESKPKLILNPPYVGKPHPTKFNIVDNKKFLFWRFGIKEEDENDPPIKYPRNLKINFETDVEENYLERNNHPGKLELIFKNGEKILSFKSIQKAQYEDNIQVTITKDNFKKNYLKEGDKIDLIATLSDSVTGFKVEITATIEVEKSIIKMQQKALGAEPKYDWCNEPDKSDDVYLGMAGERLQINEDFKIFKKVIETENEKNGQDNTETLKLEYGFSIWLYYKSIDDEDNFEGDESKIKQLLKIYTEQIWTPLNIKEMLKSK